MSNAIRCRNSTVEFLECKGFHEIKRRKIASEYQRNVIKTWKKFIFVVKCVQLINKRHQ